MNVRLAILAVAPLCTHYIRWAKPMPLFRILLFLSLLAAAPLARAEIIFNFGQGGVVGATEYQAAANSQIQLEVYLTQQGFVNFLGNNFSDLRLSFDGVGTYEFDLRIVDADMPTQGQTDVLPPQVVSDFSFGAGFLDDTNTRRDPNGDGSNHVFRGSAFATSDPTFNTLPLEPVKATNDATAQQDVPTPGPLEINSVLLGTATIDIAANASGDYTLDLFSTRPFTLIGDDPRTDPSLSPLARTATLTVTAVPEPSMVMFLGVVGLYLTRRHVRRRRLLTA